MTRYQILFLLTLGLLAACTTVGMETPAKDPALLACDEVEETMARLDGVHATNIGYGIAQANPRLKQHDWRFYALKDEEPYAFALPNGAVWVTTGLLALALNEAQYAGIAAHELAHVMHDGAGRLRLCADLLASLPAASPGGDVSAQDFVDVVIALELQVPYSAEEEAAADRDGLLYPAEVGHTPLGVVR
ncbi:MAG: M48 family metalloprotease, partial [Rhodothalassiaceae bacterium]